MEARDATAALGALAQESRLKIFRLLVEAGAEGVPAGEIARRLGSPHNTVSSHLGILEQARLVCSRRSGRSVIYAADFAGMRNLFAFLLEDCCRGRSDVCAPLLDAVLPPCCHEGDMRDGTFPHQT